MRCANCGKEFGNGTNCQSCGTDRVSGLANYSGYIGQDDNGYDSSDYGEQSFPRTTVCYACSEIIPVGSTFCPACGKQLLVECPNCGHEYSSQYPVCSKCGTNREKYIERKRREEAERKRKQKEWEQSPEYKAEIQRKKREQEKKEDSSLVLFQIIFWIGGLVLFFWLEDLIDKNWLNISLPIFDFNLRSLLIMCIGFGASFLSAVVISEINKD